MFRSDRDALAGEVEDLRREREALVAENERLRAGVLARTAPAPAYRPNIYRAGPGVLGEDERIALSRVDVQPMAVWAAVLLHFATFGLFSLIRYNLLHGGLPRIQQDDPTPAKGIGFTFIPYFNFYWIIWNTLRLTDRINFQFALRGRPEAVPRALMMVCGIVGVIPYLNILIGVPFLWPFAVYYLERAQHQLAAMDDEVVRERVVGVAEPWLPPPARAALASSAPADEAAAEAEVAEAEAEQAAQVNKL